MQRIKKILSCKEKWRCSSPLSCATCGANWQRGKFKAFTSSLELFESDSNVILSYIVIKSNKMGSLRTKIGDLFLLMDKLKELKKRNKLPSFFGRLEISFSKGSLGFNPHLNLLVWGDYKPFELISSELSLSFWRRKKTNDDKTIKSIAWYMLKHNRVGIENGEAIRKVLEMRRTILTSKDLTLKTIDYIDEIIDIDFTFMGTFPIRSKEELALRSKHKETLKDLRIDLKSNISLVSF